MTLLKPEDVAALREAGKKFLCPKCGELPWSCGVAMNLWTTVYCSGCLDAWEGPNIKPGDVVVMDHRNAASRNLPVDPSPEFKTVKWTGSKWEDVP